MRLKKSVKIVLGVIIVALLAGVVVLLALTQRVVMNPDGTVGNTAGNLNNDGRFCEYDGTVYFLNSFPEGGLFAMNPDETDFRRLNSLEVRNILAGGKYLYYYHTGISYEDSGFSGALGLRTFQRCKLNGSNATSLTTKVVVTAQLVNDYLYFLTAYNDDISFSKMKIDNSDEMKLADYQINPACAENGIIYYNGTQGNHFLYALDTATDAPREIWRGNLWNPVLEGDYVYYMDVANDYRLCRYSRSQDVIQVLADERIECFNVGGGYVYYQTNGQDAALKCMGTDGSNPTVIADGIYHNINMTSRYVYFQEFQDDTTIYHSALGSSTYEVFQGAKDAAAQD
ncbi:MAG: DUF5050 domain-containing protein [Lachnospiraceae bacterium]|nr:DUF5050 domain-containing protein [uncultured Acetatifactor sp.]MCI9573752.1 DUF5050 domain-containing protein [Lachnospiraceae bacterium]